MKSLPLLLVVGLGTLAQMQAVMFYHTGDPGYHTTAPTGSLSDSGWEYQGQWNNVLGTAISPTHFITSKHVGGQVGQIFSYNQQDYTATGFYDDQETDLRIWEVDGMFSDYASLYDRTDEVGKDLVVFGRGTQRGAEVRVNNELKGWRWGEADHVQRWGQNQVGSIYYGGSKLGNLLRVPFNYGAGSTEAHLSGGDSGGSVFIRDGTVWKLAGINYGVDSPYNTTDSGEGFNAAIYDEGGLYRKAGDQWVLVEESSGDKPGAFYSTRISTRQDWIGSVVAVPEPHETATAAAILLLAWAGWRRWRAWA